GMGHDPTVETVADRTQTYDCDPPTITITTPQDGAVYRQGHEVTADFECLDAGSGPAVCDGSVPDGGLLDTSALGYHDFTVDAEDGGERPATLTHQYRVIADTDCQGQEVTVDLRLGQEPTEGDDVILGTPGPDLIDGLGGDDVICGW